MALSSSSSSSSVSLSLLVLVVLSESKRLTVELLLVVVTIDFFILQAACGFLFLWFGVLVFDSDYSLIDASGEKSFSVSLLVFITRKSSMVSLLKAVHFSVLMMFSGKKPSQSSHWMLVKQKAVG